jgi:hypothetical protein
MAVTVPWWWEWPKACLLWLPSGAVRVGSHFIKEDEKPTREALHEQEQKEHVCFLPYAGVWSLLVRALEQAHTRITLARPL